MKVGVPGTSECGGRLITSVFAILANVVNSSHFVERPSSFTAIVNLAGHLVNLLSLSGGSAYDDCDDGEREKNNPQAHFQSDLL